MPDIQNTETTLVASQDQRDSSFSRLAAAVEAAYILDAVRR